VGAFWAAGILVIDVAVMTLLVKPPPPAPPPPQQRRRAYDREEPASPPVAEPPAPKQTYTVALRVLVSIVLGLVISHSLVLFLFKDRVAQQVALTRTEARTNLSAERHDVQQLEFRLTDAISVAAASDASFPVRYEEWLRQGRSPAANPDGSPKATPAPATPSPFSSDTITSLEVRLKDLLAKQRDELTALRTKKNVMEDGVRTFEADLKLARQMLADEGNGEIKPYKFANPEFTKALGNSTSGIPNRGERYRNIEKYVAGWEKDFVARRKELDTLTPQPQKARRAARESQRRMAECAAGCEQDGGDGISAAGRGGASGVERGHGAPEGGSRAKPHRAA
jgi:hypothetical protein